MTVRTFKQTHISTYRPLAAWLRKDLLPLTLPHILKAGSRIEGVELRAFGYCLLDGVEMEFQDLRVYVTKRE